MSEIYQTFWNTWNNIIKTHAIETEKAFDNLNGAFLFKIMEVMNFGENFIK